jgi:hypothetical protein
MFRSADEPRREQEDPMYPAEQAQPGPRSRATAILLFWMGIVLMGMIFVA